MILSALRLLGGGVLPECGFQRPEQRDNGSPLDRACLERPPDRVLELRRFWRHVFGKALAAPRAGDIDRSLTTVMLAGFQGHGASSLLRTIFFLMIPRPPLSTLFPYAPPPQPPRPTESGDPLGRSRHA